MPIDFNLLRVLRVIVHEVPKHKKGDDGTSPEFSEVESPLDDEVKRFLEERLRLTLHEHGFPIAFLEDSDSPVPSHVQSALADDQEFVDTSKAITQHLFNVQGGHNSGGLMMIAAGKVSKRRFLAVVKLELEQGARIEKSKGQGNKPTLAVRHIHDLMLSSKTRVFKAALFVHLPNNEIEAYASDPQTQMDTLAKFFLVTFLGCTFREAPRISTRSFFGAAQDFINNYIEDPNAKTDAYLGLTAEMKSGKVRVSPPAFAQAHIPRVQRDEFLKYLESVNAPSTSFTKDTELIRNKLLGFKMKFKGAAVLATDEAVENKTVRIEESDTPGNMRVVVDGELDDVKGRRT